jgi:3-deoxy-D-manno-octulosonate 8-phosphate phosphatase (KDO 8-P phosphatase)
MVKKISPKELRRRAKSIRLVLTDNDGVLTDTGVYYGEAGEMMRRYSIRDGMGVERLRAAGIETAIITGEMFENVRRRAEKLKMRWLYLGVNNKAMKLEEILKETSLTPENIAFIGDDVNDFELMQLLNATSVTAAPGDAVPEIRRLASVKCKARGGNGAFREFAEWILKMKSK